MSIYSGYVSPEEIEEMRQDMILEDWRDEQYEILMRRDDEFFGTDLETYYDEHTVMDTIEYIEHYDRDVDYWFDFLIEK